MPLTSKDIVPISQARTHLAELADDVATNHSAKMLTRNGESLVALISAADFDELQRFRQADHLRDLRRIADAVREFDAGRTSSIQAFEAEVQSLMDWVEAPEGEPLAEAVPTKSAIKPPAKRPAKKLQATRAARAAKPR
jgi:prevent-host-death family protein